MNQPESRDELLQELRARTPVSGARFTGSNRVLPGGLASGVRGFEPHPFFADHVQGSRIWDIDGNEYIDCCMCYGVLVLGHRPPVVVEAVREQIERGWIFAAPHEEQLEFAEKFVECVPCADMMVLCNSGTEATMQAIRIVRAYSGKKVVAKFEGGYHGWHDYGMWSVNMTPGAMGSADHPNQVPDSAGIPDAVKETVLVLPYAESAFGLIEQHATELAAVMIEPVFGGGSIPADKDFLVKLREVTQRNDVLLLFDEVITGFRLALGGGQEHFGVVPDLATYGKAIGGGFPIGAVGCPQEIMEKVTRGEARIMTAGTFSGNPMTLAAGNATISFLMENPQIYDEMAAKGKYLRDRVNEFARRKGLPGVIVGVGSIFQTHLRADPVTKPRDLLDQDFEALRDFQLYLRLNGVFIPRIHNGFISAAHSDEDIEMIIRAHQVALEASVTAKRETGSREERDVSKSPLAL